MRIQEQQDHGQQGADRRVREPGTAGTPAQDSAEPDEPLGHEDGPSREAVPETD